MRELKTNKYNVPVEEPTFIYNAGNGEVGYFFLVDERCDILTFRYYYDHWLNVHGHLREQPSLMKLHSKDGIIEYCHPLGQGWVTIPKDFDVYDELMEVFNDYIVEKYILGELNE